MPVKLYSKLVLISLITSFSAFAGSPVIDETATSETAFTFHDESAAQQEYVTNAEGILLGYSSDDLWQRIKDGYALPTLQSQYTAKHESWYASRPDYIKRMVARSERYLYYIVEEVEKRNMPSEIALLPMIESACNPQALSRSRAAGIWQFMPATGKHFGLQQNWWADHRKDVTAATDAALDYLQKLHLMFGTWDLALAAYNAGEGTVSRAIERNRKQGLPTDYASLPLSDETRNYVPKLQAMKNIITHPERYGLEIDSIPNQPYFTKVTAPEQIDAQLAAQLAEIPYEEFAALNPEYNRPVVTAKGDSVHEILLPVSAAETFTYNLAEYDQPLVSWQTYHAKRGERLDGIARKFGISLVKLRDVNDLPAIKTLTRTRSILVPGTTSLANAASGIDNNHFILAENSDSTELTRKQTIRHTVRPNETLYAIALRYGVTTKQIMASNALKSSRLKIGQHLLIAANSKKPATGKQNANKKHYVVKRGDTLESIARKFEIASADLKRWNNLSGTLIRPGEKLTIFAPEEA